MADSFYSKPRIKSSLHQKVKEESIKKNKSIIEMYEHIIENYFYNEENKLDHRLEEFIFEQNQKLEERFVGIGIKNARDTCTVLAALMMLIKNTAKNVNDKNELEEQIMLIGRQFFEKHWRYKKDKE